VTPDTDKICIFSFVGIVILSLSDLFRPVRVMRVCICVL